MKSLQRERYGGPEVLRVEDVEPQAPRRGEVRVAVEAVSLNLSDWEFLTGNPSYARVIGLRRPRIRSLGSDIAGIVQAIGPGVEAFEVGDAVYGDNLNALGGLAELVCLPARVLRHKPDALSFEHAACLPQAGAIAMQGIVTRGKVVSGESVLINGAGGGSGAFAIQLAKAAGARVTAVDNTAKQAFMLELGADEVIDYRAEDFAQRGARWDLILDLVATRSLSAIRRCLTDGGRYLAVGGHTNRILAAATLGPLMSLGSRRSLGILGVQTMGGVEELAERVCAGDIRIHTHGRYALEDGAEALRALGAGEALGKIVIEVGQSATQRPGVPVAPYSPAAPNPPSAPKRSSSPAGIERLATRS